MHTLNLIRVDFYVVLKGIVMVNLTYVKKRKRKKVAILVSGVTAIALTSLVVISFIGREIGHFNVGISNDGVELALSKDGTFDDKSTFIGLDKLPSYDIYSIDTLKEKYSDETLDNVSSNNDHTGKKVDSEGNIIGLYFFKYTFFVKNTGTTTADYDLTFNIVDAKKPSNVNYGLDDIMRVRFYSNAVSSNTSDSLLHEYKTYAKEGKDPHTSSDSVDPFYNSCIGESVNGICVDGYATNFSSSAIILKENIQSFKSNEIRRYTYIIWMEGHDTEASGTKPIDGFLKLNINIEGYEAKI